MPYLTCPDCGPTQHTSSAARCLDCGERLPLGSDRPPSGEGALADVVELQQKIATRIHHGGSLADIRREIIEVSALDETQRNALWLYAASRPRIRRAAPPFAGVERWKTR